MASLVRPALVGMIALCCGSCSDEYLARRDAISPGAGNAVRADIATQVINPWPRGASRVDSPTDGAFLQHAIETYRNPTVGPAPAAAPGTVGAPSR